MIKNQQDQVRKRKLFNFKSKDPNNRLNIPYYRKIMRIPYESALPA